jgi:hypothetical protein
MFRRLVAAAILAVAFLPSPILAISHQKPLFVLSQTTISFGQWACASASVAKVASALVAVTAGSGSRPQIEAVSIAFRRDAG